MRSTVLVTCMAGMAAAARPIATNSKMVHDLGLVEPTGWTAAHQGRFEGVTLEESVRLLGVDMEKHKESIAKLPQGEEAQDSDIPDSFDARTKWESCIHPIRDQGQCGSCWAFGAAESASDRLCIGSNGKQDVILSPQNLVSCDWEGNQGCNGGIPHLAWDYIELHGLPSDDCQPYHSGTTKTNGQCNHSSCESGANGNATYVPHKSKLLSTTGYSSEAAIQTAIMNDGPIEAAFQVYEDFMQYSSGVYSHQSGALLGGHAIKILGWGVDTSTDKHQKYWIIANSWGTTKWGMEGYFWMLRGENECDIESGGVAGIMKT